VQVLIALMALPLDDPFLMHEEHRVAGLQLRSLLGHGARSTVYKVELDAAEGGDEGGGKDGGRAESEGDGECSSNDRCLPDRSYCKVYTRPPEGELGRGNGWRGFDRERTALLRLQGVPNIPQIHQETSTLPSLQSSALRGCQNKTERVLVLSPVALPLWPWPARNDVVITGRHFAQLVTTVEAMHGAGVLHRDIKPANVFLQEDTNLLLLGDFDAAVALEEVKVASLPPPPAMQQEKNKVQTRSAKLKAAAPKGVLSVETLTLEAPAPTPAPTPKVWRWDQEFMWVGSVGYSDTRRSGRDSCLHTPTPEHDLVALVRTVYTLYTQKGPGSQRHGGDKDDTDAYWAERMPAASMWQNFLQMARDKDYGALRQALGRL
jgi:serine/threonine protein kinase